MIELWLHSSVTRGPKQRNASLTIQESLDESSLHESKRHETDQGKKASHHVVGALFRHGLLHRLPASCIPEAHVVVPMPTPANENAHGRGVSTELIAERFDRWQMQGDHVSVVIGGPDGLHPQILKGAEERWSFGQITLPHPLVRVILAEQLYRAWSVQAGHPYHRGS